MSFDRPIFIVSGCGRSGTTLLLRILENHPNLALGGETRLFISSRPKSTESLWTMFKCLRDIPLEVAVADHIAHAPTHPEYIRRFFQAVCDVSHRPRWGEKTPIHIKYFNAIRKQFPGAHFLSLLRDGRDVICSMRDIGSWSKRLPDVSAMAHLWKEAIAYHQAIKDDSGVMTLRYEVLVSSPEATIRRVLDFLGEPWIPGLLEGREAHKAEKQIYKGHNEGAYSFNERSGITTAQVGRWRAELTSDELQMILPIIQEELDILGY